MGIIEFNNVSFSYDGQAYALDGVNLSIAAGEFVCILGGNGSGKSTLAKHMNALLMPTSGKVSVFGKDTSDPAAAFDIRCNVGMVFQNPDDQIVASIVEDDVAFGPENIGVEPERIRSRVERALEQVGLQGFEKRGTDALSGGQKQRVAIAGALAMEPHVIVLDEAGAMLDPRGRSQLMQVCHELNDAGMTVVMITHFMEDAATADRVVVLDSGRVVLDGAPDDVLVQKDALEKLALEAPFAVQLGVALREHGLETTLHASTDALADQLAPLMSESAASTVASGADCAAQESGSEASEPVPAGSPSVDANAQALVFDRVVYTYHTETGDGASRRRGKKRRGAGQLGQSGDVQGRWALHDVSFSVREGELFGVAGPVGSGKSTLVQLCNGLLQPAAGTVSAAGRALSDRKAAALVRQDVGVVFQYPEHQLFAATVFDDVAFGPRNLGFSEAEVTQRVREALELVHLDVEQIGESSPFALSGGQQRRVAFAGVLAMRPDMLVLDEPVAGLDPVSKKAFLDLIREFHDQQGLTVVIVSHNMNDLADLCDRLLVLNDGEVLALGSPTEVFARDAELERIGLGVPDTLRMAKRLGIAVQGIPSVPELASVIAAHVC